MPYDWNRYGDAAVLSARDPIRPWWTVAPGGLSATRTDGAVAVAAVPANLAGKMADRDHDDPLPMPARKIGQVWVWPADIADPHATYVEKLIEGVVFVPLTGSTNVFWGEIPATALLAGDDRDDSEPWAPMSSPADEWWAT